MNNITFFKSFSFRCFSFSRFHHTDAAKGTVCHHIGYIKAGRADFVTEGMTYSFSCGDVFYTPPGCRYHSYWYGSDSILYDSYAFTYLPSRQNVFYKPQRLELSAEARINLRRLSENKEVGCASVGLLYSILGECLPNMETVGDRHSKSAVIDRARAYICAHPRFTMRELAAHCHISESGLYAAFRAVAGRTPVEEKHRIQIEKAVLLLSTTDLSVEEISFRVGFSSPAYFRRILKEERGVTPREIRRAELPPI